MSIKDIKREVRGWTVEKGCDLYLNILQTERSKEVGFFSNSYISIDMDELKTTLEERLNIKVDFRYKAIY